VSGDDRAQARIEAELAKLGAELSAPAGWQARVLAEATARPRRWWKFAVPALAAAVAIVVVLWAIRPPAQPPGLELAVAIQKRGEVVRGDSATVGDIATITASGGAKHRAVWVYREDRRLVIACPGAERCSSTSDSVTATVKLELPGSYTFVALTSREPLPVPTDSFDASMAAAVRAGAEVSKDQRTVR